MADVTLTVTGLSSTSSLGDLSYTGVASGYGRYSWGQSDWGDTNIYTTGWGANTWGFQSWGSFPTVELTGVSATA